MDSSIIPAILTYPPKGIQPIPHSVSPICFLNNENLDLILQKGPFDTPIGIEIKSAEAPTAGEVSSLYNLRKENSNARLVVLCRCKEAYTDGGIEFLPYSTGIEQLLTRT